MSNPYDDTLVIHMVRDNVSGGYLESSQYWKLDKIVPRSQAILYQAIRSANALRNKAGKQKKKRVDYLFRIINGQALANSNGLSDDDKRDLNDWDQRKNLPNLGYEVVTISI